MEEAMNPTPATVAVPGYLVGTWKADPAHSEIGLSVRMLMVGRVRGQFTSYDVTIVTSEDPRGSSVTAKIDLASIDTGNGRRDNHLRSADFFEVEAYPTMNYRSTGIRPSGDGWIIDGELRLHGVARQVPLALEANGFGPGRSGGQRAAFSATAQINRGDFGIDRWAGGGAVVGDKVRISLKIEAVLQQ
jgi:polyisoprenoid-binding protein YceI